MAPRARWPAASFPRAMTSGVMRPCRLRGTTSGRSPFSELQALFGAELFQDGAINAGDLAEIVNASEGMLRAPRHDRRGYAVANLQRLFDVLDRRGVHIDHSEVLLEIGNHLVELIVGAVRAIAGHLLIDLL